MNTTESRLLPARYHALDALRGFVLLLGVFYHAAESFVAGHLSWAIIDQSPSDTLLFFRHLTHSFRMEVFFLLAGFFARLVVLKRGTRSFAWNRYQRILIPLVVGWLILFPLLMAVWIAGAQKSGNYAFVPIPEAVRDLAVWKLWIGFMMSGAMFTNFSLSHLWFLHQLLVIYLLFGLARALCLKADPEQCRVQQLDHWATRAFSSRVRPLVFAIPTVGILFLMPKWTVNTPMYSLIPELGPTVLYGFCFTVGWFLHRQATVLPTFARGWLASIVLAVVMIAVTWWIQGRFDSGRFATLSPLTRRFLFEVAYGIAMWGFTFGFLGLFLQRITGESLFWRYVADSSYWVYLAHFPIVAVLGVWVAYWPIPWFFKYAVILIVTLPTLYLSYHYLVRSSFIGQQLCGKRWPRESRPLLQWFRFRCTPDA